ncbi:MAG TPA: hypothetical protein VHQ21_04130 [Rhodanobacteraceae bacterium]|jgi:hypothetical protein|nr:hypothetical protein [Rhodanobacteraceae bacterium]
MFVPIALMAASAAVSAYGKIQQGNVDSANAKSAASAARYNAGIEDQNRSLAGSMASSRELQQRTQDMQTLGNQRAALAEGGQLGAPGTSGITRQSAINAEMNALNTRYEGVLQSRNAANAESQYAYKASVYDINARQAKQGGMFGAASSLISGASSIYGYGAGKGYWGQ